MWARGWDGIALERSTKGDGNSEGGAKGPTGPAAHCQGSAVGRAEGQSAKRRGGKWRPWKATGEFFHTRRGDGENLGLGVGAHAGLVAA